MTIISTPISLNQTTVISDSSTVTLKERDILEVLRYGPQDLDLLEDRITGDLSFYLTTLKTKGSIKEENGIYTITDVGFKSLGNSLLLDITTKLYFLEFIDING